MVVGVDLSYPEDLIISSGRNFQTGQAREVLFCKEPEMKSHLLLVRIDQVPEFRARKGGRGNGHMGSSSEHLPASNTVTVPIVTRSP